MSTPEKSMERLNELAREAQKGGLYLKAAKFYHHAGELSKANKDDKNWVTNSFWAGACLKTAYKYDEALTLLMEVAAYQGMECELGDIFNALAGILEISIYRKPRTFSQKIIKQMRNWVETNNKKEWSHLIDANEGDLEYISGNFETAYRHFLNGWYAWRDENPCYTEASHLLALCNSSFRRRDIDNLRKWVALITTCEKPTEKSKIQSNNAQLLLFRAERSQGIECAHAAELALSTLEVSQLIEGVSYEEMSIAVRSLMMVDRWLDVERIFAKHPLTEKFEELLLRGDERLSRARAALGVAARDDDYDTEFTYPGKEINDAETGLHFISAAISFYERAIKKAGEEDERLETQYYTLTITERISRAKSLETAVRQRV